METLPAPYFGAAPHQTAARIRSGGVPGGWYGHGIQSRGSTATSARAGVTAQCKGFQDLKGLVFDCDGVIVDSEDLHRQAYNAAFEEFEVVVDGASAPVVWDVEFYDDLQNRIGGGKPKMRWYFGREGWPRSTVMDDTPVTDEERAVLVDTLQDYKSEKYRQLIGSGCVHPRPGVLRLMDEAREGGLHVAVCSAATKESVIYTLRSLLGDGRFERLDCFLAGDDVKNKKPDPEIYNTASERLGIPPSQCIVIEDSAIGLQAALSANMRCIVTYTGSTKNQDFSGAELVVAHLDVDPPITLGKLQAATNAR